MGSSQQPGSEPDAGDSGQGQERPERDRREGRDGEKMDLVKDAEKEQKLMTQIAILQREVDQLKQGNP